MYPGIHTGEFPTVGVHTIYMRSGAFDVNGFWDTSSIIHSAVFLNYKALNRSIFVTYTYTN